MGAAVEMPLVVRVHARLVHVAEAALAPYLVLLAHPEPEMRIAGRRHGRVWGHAEGEVLGANVLGHCSK